VFTARYALSPYIKQIRFVFKGLKIGDFPFYIMDTLQMRVENRYIIYIYIWIDELIKYALMINTPMGLCYVKVKTVVVLF
jgi:hypothetical protein